MSSHVDQGVTDPCMDSSPFQHAVTQQETQKLSRLLKDETMLQSIGGLGARRLRELALINNDSALGNALSTALLNSAANSIYEDRKKSKHHNIRISEFLTDDQKTFVESCFRQFSIDFQGFRNHGHSIAKVLRILSYHEIFVDKVKIFGDQSFINFDHLVCDVGGNVKFYFDNKWNFVHSCNPVLDIQDCTRKAYLNYVVETRDDFKSFLAKNSTLRCEQRAQDCMRTSKYTTFIHSGYDIKLNHLARILDVKKSIAAFGVIHYSPEMFFLDKGFISDSGIRWIVDRKRNEIQFSFDDNSLNYIHNYTEYVKFLKTDYFFDSERRNLGRFYTISWGEIKGGSISYTILPTAFRGYQHTSRNVPFPLEYNDTVVVRYFDLKRELSVNPNYIFPLGMKETFFKLLERKTLILPRKFVISVFNHAMASQDGNLNLRSIYTFARSKASVITLDGTSKVQSGDYTVEDLIGVVLAAYQYAYRQRFRMTKVVKIFGNYEDHSRTIKLLPRIARAWFVVKDAVWNRSLSEVFTKKIDDLWSELMHTTSLYTDVGVDYFGCYLTVQGYVNGLWSNDGRGAPYLDKPADYSHDGLKFEIIEVPGDGFCSVHTLNVLLEREEDEWFYKNILTVLGDLDQNLSVCSSSPEGWLTNVQLFSILNHFGRAVVYFENGHEPLFVGAEDMPVVGLSLSGDHFSPLLRLDEFNVDNFSVGTFDSVYFSRAMFTKFRSNKRINKYVKANPRTFAGLVDYVNRSWSKKFNEIFDEKEDIVLKVGTLVKKKQAYINRLLKIINSFKYVSVHRVAGIPYYLMVCRNYGVCSSVRTDNLLKNVETNFGRYCNSADDYFGINFSRKYESEVSVTDITDHRGHKPMVSRSCQTDVFISLPTSIKKNGLPFVPVLHNIKIETKRKYSGNSFVDIKLMKMNRKILKAKRGLYRDVFGLRISNAVCKPSYKDTRRVLEEIDNSIGYEMFENSIDCDSVTCCSNDVVFEDEFMDIEYEDDYTYQYPNRDYLDSIVPTSPISCPFADCICRRNVELSDSSPRSHSSEFQSALGSPSLIATNVKNFVKPLLLIDTVKADSMEKISASEIRVNFRKTVDKLTWAEEMEVVSKDSHSSDGEFVKTRKQKNTEHKKKLRQEKKFFKENCLEKVCTDPIKDCVTDLARNQHFYFKKSDNYSINAAREWYATVRCEAITNMRLCKKVMTEYNAGKDLKRLKNDYPTISIFKDKKLLIKAKSGSVVENPMVTDGTNWFPLDSSEGLVASEDKLSNSVVVQFMRKYSTYCPCAVDESKIRMVRGVFGCGKTTYVLNKVASKDCVLCSTVKGAEDVKNRLNKLNKKNVQVRTLDSVLLNGFKEEPDNVYIDEAFMNHCGKLSILMGNLKNVKHFYFIGDDLQLPAYVRMASSAKVCKFIRVFPHIESFCVLSDNYRNPVDVCKVFSPDYAKCGIKITPKSGRDRSSMFVQKIRSINDVTARRVKEASQVLTFTQVEKMTLQQKFKSFSHKIHTVHEFQGSQGAITLLVRLEDKQANKIFESAPHTLVALTRHSESLTYLTMISGDRPSRKIYASGKKAGYYPEIGRPALHVYHESDLRIPKKLKQKYVDEHNLKTIVVMKGINYSSVKIKNFWDLEKEIPTTVPRVSVGHQIVYSQNPSSVLFIYASEKIFDSSKDKRNFGYDYGEFVSIAARNNSLVIRDRKNINDYLKVISDFLNKDSLQFYERGLENFYDSFVSRMGLVEGFNVRPFISTVETEVLEDSLDYLEADASEITNVIEEILPGTTYTDNEYDWLLVSEEEINYSTNSGTINLDADLPKEKSFDYLTPLVKSSIQAPVIHNLNSYMKALEKRNLNVVHQSEVVDYDALMRYLDHKFTDLYCDIDRFKAVTSDKIIYSRCGFNDWLKTQDSKILSMIGLDSDFSVVNFNVYDLMLKTTAKPDLTVDSIYRICQPQVIAAQSKLLNAYFCPMVRMFSERVISSLKDNVFINTGMTVEELALRMTSILPARNDYHSCEIDMSKFDKSQGYLALRVECMLMKKFGFTDELVDLWRYCHEITYLSNRQIGLKQKVNFQRKSGDAMTYIGNTLITMCTLAMALEGNSFELALFSGDDSLMLSHLPFTTTGAHDIMARIMNFEVKIFDYTSYYFCSKFLIAIDDCWLFVPDPLKFMIKLGRHDLVNYDHVEEYRISSYDLFKNSFNPYVASNMSECFIDRYKVIVDFDYVYAILKYFLMDKKNFSKLYKFEGDREFDGVKLPSLDI